MGAGRQGDGVATVLASWTATVVRALTAHGFDGDELARRAGIDPAVFDVAGARVPLTRTTELWRLAVAVTGDPCFSLQVARLVRPSTFAGLSMGMVASATFRLAMERLARFHAVVCTSSGASVVVERDGLLTWTYRFAPSAERPCDESLEAVAASITAGGRFLVERSLSPVAVHFARPQAPAGSRFEAYFGRPIRYGAPEYRLDFALDSVDRPIPIGSGALAEAADRIADNELRRLSAKAGFSDEVRAAVTGLIGETVPTAVVVAETVAVSPRTLQRHLRAEGTTLRRIVSQVQVERAKQLLADGQLSVEAVAAHLGFHDGASFRRAFKRQTGTTPAQYAKAALSRPGRP